MRYTTVVFAFALFNGAEFDARFDGTGFNLTRETVQTLKQQVRRCAHRSAEPMY